jgi:hypothetical protein
MQFIPCLLSLASVSRRVTTYLTDAVPLRLHRGAVVQAPGW